MTSATHFISAYSTRRSGFESIWIRIGLLRLICWTVWGIKDILWAARQSGTSLSSPLKKLKKKNKLKSSRQKKFCQHDSTESLQVCLLMITNTSTKKKGWESLKYRQKASEFYLEWISILKKNKFVTKKNKTNNEN